MIFIKFSSINGSQICILLLVIFIKIKKYSTATVDQLPNELFLLLAVNQKHPERFMKA